MVYLLIAVGLLGTAALGFLIFMAWLTRPVVYSPVAPVDLQRFLRAWGEAIADRGKIVVQSVDRPGEVHILKRTYKSQPNTLTFRFRNADETRQYFPEVCKAISDAGIAFEIEKTLIRKKPRAIRTLYEINNPLVFSALSELVKLSIQAMGVPEPLRLRIHCEALPKPDFQPSGSDFILWTKPHLIGFKFGRFLARILGRF